jgi:chorismate mutase/prephenate dehydratase
MSDPKREIEVLRREIALQDAQLVGVLEKRAKLSRAVFDLRKDQPAVIPLNERAALEALLARATGDMPVESLRAILREVFAACLGLEMPVKVAYLGPEGSAGFSVGRGHFGASAVLVPAETAAAALEEVTRQRAQFALVPYETSADGPVQATIMALVATELRIVLVLETAPSLDLLNRTGNVQDVEKVYATAGDRLLCDRSLAGLGKASVLDVKSPLFACQLAAEDHGAAALASELLGAPFGLEVARRNVLDRGHDRVRHAIIGTRPATRTGEDYSAVVFSLHDAPGALLDVLRQFAERGINLSKIQSRPVEADGWAYLFFLEVVGHATDRALVTAFEEVRRTTKFFKVLGSYPARA